MVVWARLFTVDVSDRALHEGPERLHEESIQPKTSIIERYIAKEAIEFCSEYIETGTLVRLP